MANKASFTQGDTPQFVFPITLNGAVTDLGGYTALFTITNNAAPTSDTDAAVRINYTIPSGSNIAKFQTPELQTASLNPSTQYYWSMKLKDPTSTYYSTVISGTATIKQSYTQRIS